MSDFKVVDKTGKWYVNPCLFVMTEQPRLTSFAPGVPMKVDESEWIKEQVKAGVLRECADPFGEPPKKPVKAEAPPPIK